MPSTKRSATDKRNSAKAPHVKTLETAQGPAFPAGNMLISSPNEIAAVVNRIPEGRVLTLSHLRNFLAARHAADYTCPVTTGIFLRILAEAVEEAGEAETPYWRVVHDDGTLLDKLPGGPTEQARRLREEGVVVAASGKKHLKIPALGELVWIPA